MALKTIDCTKLDGDISNCGVAVQRIFKQTAYIIDVEQIATKPLSGNLITDLTLTGSNKLHTVKMNALKPFDGTKVTSAQQLAAVLFNNETKFVILGNTPESAGLVQNLTNGRYMMIFVQEGVDTSSKYYVQGVEIGLKFDTAEMVAGGEALGWTVTLKEDMAIGAGYFLWKTNSLSATDALITSLLPA